MQLFQEPWENMAPLLRYDVLQLWALKGPICIFLKMCFERHRWIPLGQATGLGLLENVFGDISMIVKRDVFIQLGGFSSNPGTTFTDWSVALPIIIVMSIGNLISAGSFMHARHWHSID
jgi:hypothetical protein